MVEARERDEAPLSAEVPTLFEFTRSRLSDQFGRRQISSDFYERAYRLRIHPRLGSLTLDELTPQAVRDWSDAVISEYGDRQAAKDAFKTLQWLLNEAVDAALIPFNPAAGIRFGKRARRAVELGAPSAADHATKKPTLTRNQYERLKTHAGTEGLEHLLLVRLPTECMLRRSELTAMSWEGFHPERRVFGVTSGVTYTRETGTTIGHLKTSSSYREVVLSADLCDVLSQYREVQSPDATDYLFAGRSSGEYDATTPRVPNNISAQVSHIIRRSGVVDTQGKAYTNLQGLRATGASLAAAAGIPQALIDAQTGHKGTTVFERHYRDVRNAPERFRVADLFEPLADEGVSDTHREGRSSTDAALLRPPT